MPREKKSKYIDKYEVLEEIGRGGMGAVYKALHPQFKKYVAIKEIRSNLADDPDIQRRFEREAELLARLPPHPNIVTVRDALVWDERLYLVMDYIEGETLSEIVRQGGVGPEIGADLLGQILSGLDAIHRSGIVHRDLKAGNILIDREGTAYISDFGIAERIGKRTGSSAMATAKYAAPELIDPKLGRGGAEQQVDIYAAGMLAYEMLLGERYFHEAFREVYNGTQDGVAERWLNWHTNLSRTVPDLTEINHKIPRPLAAIVERMVAKDVNERYRNADDARRDLAAYMLGAQDARNRRTGPPPDDPTMPIDRMRRGGARADEPILPRHSPPERQPSRGQKRSAIRLPDILRSVPLWTWWVVGGAGALFVIGIMSLAASSTRSGFTLIVHDAPSGSEVYVDGIRRGVPSADGTIKVWGLKSGKIEVSVFYEGSECGLNLKSVTGEDGEQKDVYAECKQLLEKIDYNGEMILIPAGKFIMGDDNYEDNEKPRHEAEIPYDYYIDKYEVTNKQYKIFCDQTPNCVPPTKDPRDEEYFNNNPDSPVIGVSWHEAKAYAEWAGKRLPTEQEWEKAASWDQKALKKYKWPWGDRFDESRAVFPGTLYPAPVGEYGGDISPYGVQGMAGNASEWVEGDYKGYRSDSPQVADYERGYKVVRGGSCTRTDIGEARTTYRQHYPPDERESKGHRTAIGFRCAVSANDSRLQKYLRDHGLSK